MITRRRFVRNASAASVAAFGLPLVLAEAAARTYRNPIMGGDHPDASPIRVGNHFYLTHSSFDYTPGLLIWRSSDLVNWRPVGSGPAPVLRKRVGSLSMRIR
jgi:xylan 1,4-beta-xylosidase